ncbi:hypothetical protein, partial [Mesorhizobium sp. M0208]|uniref:hypothetical protein n=1 Tax=Mesorhizobium sp. M0208 TaxID=2956916 RepID=UPI0033387190
GIDRLDENAPPQVRESRTEPEDAGVTTTAFEDPATAAAGVTPRSTVHNNLRVRPRPRTAWPISITPRRSVRRGAAGAAADTLLMASTVIKSSDEAADAAGRSTTRPVVLFFGFQHGSRDRTRCVISQEDVL